MNNELNKLTDMPADSVAEKIFYYGHDTILFPAGSGGNAILESKPLFNATDKKSKVFKTNDFPLSSGRVARILGLRFTHNFVFAENADLIAFEEFATIKQNIEDKDYSGIPVFDLLPYNRVNSGKISSYREFINSIQQVATDPVAPADHETWYNTDTGLVKYFNGTSNVVIPQQFVEQYQVLALNGKFKSLGKPIDPPHDGQIDFTFEPGLKDAVLLNVAANGTKFGANIYDSSDSPLFWGKVSWYGELIRKTR